MTELPPGPSDVDRDLSVISIPPPPRPVPAIAIVHHRPAMVYGTSFVLCVSGMFAILGACGLLEAAIDHNRVNTFRVVMMAVLFIGGLASVTAGMGLYIGKQWSWIAGLISVHITLTLTASIVWCLSNNAARYSFFSLLGSGISLGIALLSTILLCLPSVRAWTSPARR